MRRDLRIQIMLPVHSLGNRLNDEIATAKHLEMFVIVCRDDEVGQIGRAQRRRL